MKILIFLVLSGIIAFFPLNVLRLALDNPNFGSFGGKAAYFRLFLILAIGFFLIFGLYHMIF
tara:strand:- start:611 stop:796 length:186 start_codon:yes stop_codon:yes gene_type:complete